MYGQTMIMQRTILIFLAAVLFTGISIGQETTSPAKKDDSLKVMSFNIRYGTANDGANHWDKRHELVIKTIQAGSPDLLGTQETLAFQADYLRKHLPQYSWVGRGRESSPEKGEQCAVFFKTNRFEKLAEGHFWLSAEPDKPGSRGWDAALPRMVTWVKLKDRQSGNSLVWFNTHFDHRGAKARLESARLLARKVPEIAGGHYFIVTGDFNSSVASKPYLAMFGKSDDAKSVMIDTFRRISKNQDKPQGTFNGFKGTSSGARIDWIAASARFEITAAEIDKFEINGQYPSDHFPVTATLRFNK